MAIISFNRKKEVTVQVMMLLLICMCCLLFMSFVIDVFFVVLLENYFELLFLSCFIVYIMLHDPLVDIVATLVQYLVVLLIFCLHLLWHCFNRCLFWWNATLIFSPKSSTYNIYKYLFVFLNADLPMPCVDMKNKDSSYDLSHGIVLNEIFIVGFILSVQKVVAVLFVLVLQPISVPLLFKAIGKHEHTSLVKESWGDAYCRKDG